MGAFRGLGAESPVFLPGRGQKNAPGKYTSAGSMLCGYQLPKKKGKRVNYAKDFRYPEQAD
jgi:hypothetical protein